MHIKQRASVCIKIVSTLFSNAIFITSGTKKKWRKIIFHIVLILYRKFVIALFTSLSLSVFPNLYFFLTLCKEQSLPAAAAAARVSNLGRSKIVWCSCIPAPLYPPPPPSPCPRALYTESAVYTAALFALGETSTSALSWLLLNSSLERAAVRINGFSRKLDARVSHV